MLWQSADFVQTIQDRRGVPQDCPQCVWDKSPFPPPKKLGVSNFPWNLVPLNFVFNTRGVYCDIHNRDRLVWLDIHCRIWNAAQKLYADGIKALKWNRTGVLSCKNRIPQRDPDSSRTWNVERHCEPRELTHNVFAENVTAQPLCACTKCQMFDRFLVAGLSFSGFLAD